VTRDRLLALIEQVESDIARVEDAMNSAHLAIKRLMADMRSDGELDAKANRLEFLVRDGTMYETRKEE
jgi:hypothetical protein